MCLTLAQQTVSVFTHFVVSIVCSSKPIPESLQELLVNASDLDQLAQASRINDVLGHLTSSANHLDCSVKKKITNQDIYSLLLINCSYPSIRQEFFTINLKNWKGGHLILVHKSNTLCHSVQIFSCRLKIVKGGGVSSYIQVNTALACIHTIFSCLSLF
jgi:hypothetical protein